MKKTISITVPGSKSISNRALVLAALTNGTTIIKNIALCDDTNYMIKGLKKLGIKITQKGETVKITGIYKNDKLNFPQKKGKIEIYTGNAGTTTRFLTALATLTGNEVIIDGDARMRERPIAELTKSLNQLGANITTNNGYPPVHIRPSLLRGGKISLPGDISSQYLSAILMISPFASEKTMIHVEQELCSKPYVEMTLKMMKEFGMRTKNKNFKQLEIPSLKTKSKPSKHAKLAQKNYTVESDASSASYIGAYAALHPERKILLNNIFRKSLQGDIKFLDYLKKMSCSIHEQKNGTEIQGPKQLKSLGTINMNNFPDIVMTFAILAMFTNGKTKITNIGNLRIKETDRLEALENEIAKLAKFTNLPIKVKTGKDWIEIESNITNKHIPKTDLVKINRVKSVHVNESESEKAISQSALINRSGTVRTHESKIKKETSQIDQCALNSPRSRIPISTYNDHRIAMSFGILTDIFPFLKIENPNCVSKSYTTFWEDLKKLQKSQKPLHLTNIVLTGLRGSGKTKIGKLLSEKLTRKFIDTDQAIEDHEKTTIKDIVELRGWEYFRAIESKVAQKIAKSKNLVISTGGGTILNRDNEKALKKTGKIIYLYVKPEICAQRILDSKTRPPLTNKESVEEEIKYLYKQRNGRYCESANLIFERSEDLESDAEEIIRKLGFKS